MTIAPNIHFFFKNVTVGLPERTKLKRFIQTIFRREGKKLKSLNYVFCSDEKLLKINKTYLKHDFYTDIVTFDLSENSRQVTGEVYISVDRVRENANLFKTTLREELLRVIFHGALHLCGYEDRSPRQKALMRRKENFYLMNYMKTREY
jgi:probable rRNA maturation factor